jgi:single-strand DNA-binding protein
MNKVILMGRLTADPELKQTASGVNVCNFTVAVDRRFTPQGQERQADFIPIVAWRQTAEFVCKYFSKGKMIALDGDMRVRSYNDTRHPAVKHYVTEVYANDVYFTGDKQQGAGGYQGSPDNARPPQDGAAPPPLPPPSISVGDLSDFEEIIGDSDLPF